VGLTFPIHSYYMYARTYVVPADWLDTFQFRVNSAYHSVFTFLVRVERVYSDSWLSSSYLVDLLYFSDNLRLQDGGRCSFEAADLCCCSPGAPRCRGRRGLHQARGVGREGRRGHLGLSTGRWLAGCSVRRLAACSAGDPSETAEIRPTPQQAAFRQVAESAANESNEMDPSVTSWSE
jgi:hypothetical protein